MSKFGITPVGSAHIRDIEKRLGERAGAPAVGKLVIRRCCDDDLPGLLELVRSVGWQLTSEALASVMRFGEMWCLVSDGVIVGSAGWLPHGKNCAWIVMVVTRQEWRGCSIATTLMLKVLERTEQYPERMLDASPFGEPVYRRLGFRECAKVHILAVGPSDVKTPKFAWRPMKVGDFPLPGVDERNPAHRYIFGNSPELCRVLERNGRIAGWFLGREKAPHTHIGPIYAEDEDIAIDAFHAARAMLPESTLIFPVSPDERELFATVAAASTKTLTIQTRMYFADHPVPPFPPHMRSSAGPDFG